MKKRTTHVRDVADVNLVNKGENFVIELVQYIDNEYENQKITKLHLEMWHLRVLANLFWQNVRYVQEQHDKAIDWTVRSLKGNQ